MLPRSAAVVVVILKYPKNRAVISTAYSSYCTENQGRGHHISKIRLHIGLGKQQWYRKFDSVAAALPTIQCRYSSCQVSRLVNVQSLHEACTSQQ